MTKKELVKLLNEKFTDDEEVFVKFCDDQGECVEPISKVDNVSQTFEKYEYEVNIDGKWVPYTNKLVHPRRVYDEYLIRTVNHKQWTETKKCICT
jgi:hypothetical protein